MITSTSAHKSSCMNCIVLRRVALHRRFHKHYSVNRRMHAQVYSIDTSVKLLSCCGKFASHMNTKSCVLPCTSWWNHARNSTAQHSAAQRSIAQHSSAQRSAAQHSTARHSTAQHGTTRHNTTRRSGGPDWTVVTYMKPIKPIMSSHMQLVCFVCYVVHFLPYLYVLM